MSLLIYIFKVKSDSTFYFTREERYDVADNNYILRGYPTGQSVESALNKGKQSITETEVITRLSYKQDSLTPAQMQAVNSGMTADSYNNLVTSVQTVNSKVLANIPAGQELKYASNITVEMNPNTYVITAQLWDQKGARLGNAVQIDLPLESVVVGGYYDASHKQLVLTLKNSQTIIIPISDLISGLQPLINQSNKLSADLVDDSNTSNKFMSGTQYLRLISSVNKVKMNGMSNVSGLTIEDGSDNDKIITHTNIVNSVDSMSFKKVAYDNHGHITSSTDVTKNDITGLVSGADLTLTGYNKAGSVRAITSSDSVNTAIGILEKAIDGAGVGTVSRVALDVPHGMYVEGSPITTQGTLSIKMQSGYTIPTTATINSKVSAKIDETDNEMLVLF